MGIYNNSILKLLTVRMLLVALSGAASDITPYQWLSGQTKPIFADNNSLPMLTKYSWPTFDYDLRVEMATNWGFALDLQTYNSLVNGGLEKDLTNTNSVTFKLLTLVTNFPGKFKAVVNLEYGSYQTNAPRGMWITNAAGYFVDNLTNTWMDSYPFTNHSFAPVFSPEAPDVDLTNYARFICAPLTNLFARVPIAIILNGGERDLGVAGYDVRAWRQDPRVQAQAVMTNAYADPDNTNGMSWPRYISNRKAHQLAILTSFVKADVPNRELYVFYKTDNEKNRFNIPGYGSWEDEWSNWGWDSAVMNPALDTPALEAYYTGGTSWTNVTGVNWNDISDLLTHQLNAVGYNYTLGYTNSYTWVCGGWSNTDTNKLSDIPRYIGFLKCLYISGTIGANAGYYEYPTNTTPGSIFGNDGFTGLFPSNSPPHWLQQIAALSHVHAFFSQHTNFLYGGSLLSGDGKNLWSRDQPAYEFTNTVADSTARVIVNKLNNTNLWLACAWAASGNDRDVTVTIPTAGTVTLNARVSGAVYQVTSNSVTLLDANGVLPDYPSGTGYIKSAVIGNMTILH